MSLRISNLQIIEIHHASCNFILALNFLLEVLKIKDRLSLRQLFRKTDVFTNDLPK